MRANQDLPLFRFGSLFAGIGGIDLGLERAGMQCAWQVEIDKHCREVLGRHWPNVTKMEDVCNVGKSEPVDLICGGFPCQDLSVAGKRKGLAGERSGLWFEFHRIIESNKPGWVVIENVPGLLSSNGGADFAVLLQGLVQLGYGVCWRVFDSQYFGVAQRRRRVFIVGHLGDGRAAEVLFEREGGAWDPAPSREKGKGIAGTLDAKSASSNSNRGSQANETDFITPGIYQWASGGGDDMKDTAQTLRSGAEANYQFIAFNARRTEIGPIENLSPTLNPSGGGSQSPGVAYNIQQNDGGDHKRKDRPNGGMYVNETDTSLTLGSANQAVAYALNTKTRIDAETETFIWEGRSKDKAPRLHEGAEIVPSMTKHWGTDGGNVPLVGVRRLTPTECERLQGFPDGWTFASDTQRYRQLGNAVTVNVAEWIGRRIMEAHNG